jgi:uncharacterized protein YggE
MKAQVLRIGTFFAIITGTLLMWGQQAPPGIPTPNTVYVGADGKYEAAPDTALLQFNLSPQEATAKAAYDHASRSADKIRQILRDNGIPPNSAEIGYFSISPVYDWRQPQRKLIGYRVTSAVTLKLKDFSKVAPLIQQIADTDVTENQSLSYILDDIEAAKVKAVQNAYQHAHGEAEALAKAGGRALGELSYSSVDVYEQPRPIAPMNRMMMHAETAGEQAPAPNAEFTPQRVVVTAHVNTLFELK